METANRLRFSLQQKAGLREANHSAKLESFARSFAEVWFIC